MREPSWFSTRNSQKKEKEWNTENNASSSDDDKSVRLCRYLNLVL